MPQSGIQTSTTLAAGVAAQIAAPLSGCTCNIISNNGTAPMVFKFGSSPTSAIDGIGLDGASSSGGQGGSMVLTGAAAFSDAIFAFSANSAGEYDLFGRIRGEYPHERSNLRRPQQR